MAAAAAAQAQSMKATLVVLIWILLLMPAVVVVIVVVDATSCVDPRRQGPFVLEQSQRTITTDTADTDRTNTNTKLILFGVFALYDEKLNPNPQSPHDVNNVNNQFRNVTIDVVTGNVSFLVNESWISDNNIIFNDPIPQPLPTSRPDVPYNDYDDDPMMNMNIAATSSSSSNMSNNGRHHYYYTFNVSDDYQSVTLVQHHHYYETSQEEEEISTIAIAIATIETNDRPIPDTTYPTPDHYNYKNHFSFHNERLERAYFLYNGWINDTSKTLFQQHYPNISSYEVGVDDWILYDRYLIAKALIVDVSSSATTTTPVRVLRTQFLTNTNPNDDDGREPPRHSSERPDLLFKPPKQRKYNHWKELQILMIDNSRRRSYDNWYRWLYYNATSVRYIGSSGTGCEERGGDFTLNAVGYNYNNDNNNNIVNNQSSAAADVNANATAIAAADDDDVVAPKPEYVYNLYNILGKDDDRDEIATGHVLQKLHLGTGVQSTIRLILPFNWSKDYFDFDNDDAAAGEIETEIDDDLIDDDQIDDIIPSPSPSPSPTYSTAMPTRTPDSVGTENDDDASSSNGGPIMASSSSSSVEAVWLLCTLLLFVVAATAVA